MKEIKFSDLGVFIQGKVWGKKTLLKFAEGSLKKNEVLWFVYDTYQLKFLKGYLPKSLLGA